jgi:zinc protease
MEQLIFEKNELIDYLESTGMRFGADLNAYTSFEETVYILQSRTDSLEYLEKAFLILEDWASGLQF